MGRSDQARLRLPKHVKAYTINGRTYYYFRGSGSRISGLPWSPEFMEAYEAALASYQKREPVTLPSTLPGGIIAKRRINPDAVQPLIGVYLLLLKGKVVYIGQSLNMPNRVAEHRANGRSFDQAFYVATKANERERLEVSLIRAINPLQNRRHTSGNSVGPLAGGAN